MVSGHPEVFEVARSAANLSNDHDVGGVRDGYKGIAIPYAAPLQVGFLGMNPRSSVISGPSSTRTFTG